MAKETLFGLTIEDDDGNLVFTVNGVLAQGLRKQIRNESEVGRGGELLAKLMPFGSFYKLLTFTPPIESGSDELSIEQMLGQNIDQTFASFETQIAELKSSLTEIPEQQVKPSSDKHK